MEKYYKRQHTDKGNIKSEIEFQIIEWWAKDEINDNDSDDGEQSISSYSI